MRRPDLSVIIPAYNRQSVIGACLKSIIDQSIPPTEIVVVDDGSEDGTADVVASLETRAKAVDCRLVCLRQENAGKSVALNAGWSAAKGEWIAFNDSDDLWHPQKLERQLAALERHPECEAVFSDCRYVNDPSLTQTTLELRGFTPEKDQETLERSHIAIARNPYGIFMQSLVVSRRCADAVFPLHPDMRVAQDIDLLFRLSLETDFCFVNEALVDIDRSDALGERLTKTHDMRSLPRLKTLERIVERWTQIPHPRAAEARPILMRRLADTRHQIGKALQAAGDTAKARDCFKQALDTSRTWKSLARCTAATVGTFLPRAQRSEALTKAQPAPASSRNKPS